MTQGAPPPDSSALPAWAEWRQAETGAFTLGVEEELMLLDSEDFALANQIEAVMPRLAESVVMHATPETHNSAVELRTSVHTTVGDSMNQLGELRAGLAETLATLGLCAAGSGTHPFAIWQEITVTDRDRYEFVRGSMRELARREPTFALHVHVGLPDPETAIQVHNRLRVHLPLLLAISANSPFWQGRDTGLASARTPLFQAFPRVGIPRPFRDYAHYAKEVDLLIRTDAVPDRSYLWWDVRPQPEIGTVEIRSMDAQSRTDDNAALVALVQSLVRLEAEERVTSELSIDSQEAISENRFLAARDGVHATLIDADREIRRPVPEILEELIEAARPHAQDLGCESELELNLELVKESPADRQRAVFAESPSLAQMVRGLTDEFV